MNGILGGGIIQPAEEVDVNIVDAVRNDLVRINADVFAFHVAREWDVGLGTMNQIRADLMNLSLNPYIKEAVGYAGSLSPYTSWEDFQTRNSLSDALIRSVQTGLSGSRACGGRHRSLPGDQPGDRTGRPGPTTRLRASTGSISSSAAWPRKHINGGMVGQTMWVILHEQLDRLAGRRSTLLHRPRREPRPLSADRRARIRSDHCP